MNTVLTEQNNHSIDPNRCQVQRPAEFQTALQRGFMALLFIFGQVVSDAQPCNGFHYLVQIFAESQVITGVQYGQNTTIGGAPQDLLLDIYEPLGDTTSNRALVILIHPGITGDYSKEDLSALGFNLAEKGHLVASIDYRPLDIDVSSGLSEDDFFEWLHGASNDLKAAIRYFRELQANGNPYGMKAQNVFCLGLGAGALIADQAAYLDENDDIPASWADIIAANGGFEGNSNDITGYSSAPRAVVSCSGGLLNAQWIDNTEPLLFAIHDDGDPIMPYTNGAFLINDGSIAAANIEGTSFMQARAQETELYHVIETISSDEHLSYWSNEVLLTSPIMNGMGSFYVDIMCNGVVSSISELSYEVAPHVYPNPTQGMVFLEGEPALIGKEIELVDVLGNTLLRTRLTAERTPLDCSGLSEGTYMVRVVGSTQKPVRMVKY